VNLALSHRRRSKLRGAVSLDGTAGDGEGDAGRLSDRLADGQVDQPHVAMQHAEAKEHVARALLALEPDYRAAVVLRDVEGLDYQEIADVLEVPVGTVKSRIFRGRLAMREHLSGQGGINEGGAA
jgi:RNA polymerase sigma-70 factor (ECF subfamily)